MIEQNKMTDLDENPVPKRDEGSNQDMDENSVPKRDEGSYQDMDENPVPKRNEGSNQDMDENPVPKRDEGKNQDGKDELDILLSDGQKLLEKLRIIEEDTFGIVKAVPEDSATVTATKIKFNYLWPGEFILELDIEEGTANEKGTKIKELKENLRQFGNFILECGRKLPSHMQEPYGNVNLRWEANVEIHGWLNESPKALKVTERTEDMEIRIKQFKEEEIYRMAEGGRKTKVCLIIANSKFDGWNDMNACEVDSLYLSALFEGLYFDVVVARNLTVEQMENFLRTKKNEIDGGVECFVCAISSHGCHEGVLGSDRKVTKFQTILNMFDRDSCEKLANKPKLFLFDVCRGRSEDRVQTKIEPMNPADGTTIPPIKSDTLVAHATSFDYVSFCHPKFGSWFCRSFVKVVSENACRYSVLEMLLMVNRIVGTFKSDGCMQSARFDCSMRKQFFFSLQAKEKAAVEQTTSKPIQVAK